VGTWAGSGKKVRGGSSGQLLNGLEATAETIDLPRRAVRNIEIVDGWLVESGREHLGCRDGGEGGRIEGGVTQKGVLAGL
jgi:hypothetical protein